MKPADHVAQIPPNTKKPNDPGGVSLGLASLCARRVTLMFGGGKRMDNPKPMGQRQVKAA